MPSIEEVPVKCSLNAQDEFSLLILGGTSVCLGSPLISVALQREVLVNTVNKAGTRTSDRTLITKPQLYTLRHLKISVTVFMKDEKSTRSISY